MKNKKIIRRMIAGIIVLSMLLADWAGEYHIFDVQAADGEETAAVSDTESESSTEDVPEGTESAPEETENIPEDSGSLQGGTEGGPQENTGEEEREIELLMRPADEADSSDMVYYLEESYDSYSWEVWDGEEWQEIGEYEAELTVDKEQFYMYRFRCAADREGVLYIASAADDWQIEDLGVMTLAANDTGSSQSDYMYYSNGTSFNIRGIDGDKTIQTTFLDAGYRTASAVNGDRQLRWNASSEVAMGHSLYGSREITLVYNGRYAMIKYKVENRGSTAQSFKIGSSADVMIDNNDFAPVKGSGSGLVMSGEPKNKYKFNLVAPTADTLWYGHYSKAYDNIFTDLADKNTPYEKDSGMAWSWSGTVAPGSTWSRYVLLGVGELPTPPNDPSLTNRDPVLKAGETTTFTGKANPGNTVCVEVDGKEYTGIVDGQGNFSVPVNVPLDTPPGSTTINYYAVTPDGGISDVQSITGTVIGKPSITLTDSAVSVMEDSVLTDAWYRGFIKSSNGTVSYNASSVKTATPGTYTVTFTAKQSGYPDASATLRVTVLPLPLELSALTATRVSGKDSFTLSSSLKHTGGDTISETGYVWGIMQNPTRELNNGQQKTASVVKTKNGTLSVTANQIVDGVTYWARAYAVTTNGNVYYGPQNSFSINGKSYGTFTIKNNGNNTFTVTRTGGTDGTQKVYFRTVNGSAVGGTHFTHQASYLSFGQGETSKNITVAENSVTSLWGGKAATAYSNADRTYQVEIYRVEGGGMLGSTVSATRTMAKNSQYVVPRTLYDAKERSVSTDNDNRYVVDRSKTKAHQPYFRNNRGYNTSHGQNNFNVQRTLDVGNDTERAYLKATANGYNYQLRFTAEEVDDAWEHIWIADHAPNNMDSSNEHDGAININDNLFGSAKFTARWDITGQADMTFPGNSVRSNIKSYSESVRSGAVSGSYLQFGINDTANVWFAAMGKDKDIWRMRTFKDWVKVRDEKEPQLLGMAPMAGTYKAGDKVTVSLVFDEIVDSQNSTLSSVSLNTSWGTFRYAGGANTNVLYFTGTVPADATATLKLNSITNPDKIKDMCEYSTTSTGSGSGTNTYAQVDHKKPTVSISSASVSGGTAKAVISATNASTFQYTWSQSSAMPVSGWINASSGQTVSTRQTSGTWYLHVLGTYSVTGTTAYQSKSFSFSGSAGVLPDLTLSADNSTWAQSRTITLTKTPSGASVTVKTPSGQTSAVSGTTYPATANGSYTFTLTSGSDTVIKTITVSRIDRTSPSAVITGPGTLTQNENVTLGIKPADTGGAGVKSVTGTWTRTTNGGASANVTATLKKNSDGTYTAVTPGTAGNQYTYRLNITVTDNAGNTKQMSSSTYTVNLKAPIVTVTKKSSSNKGDTYSYTVNANGNTITAIELPDGTITTALSGTFQLTAPGTYYVTVSDAAGHVVRSQAMTVAAGVDGDAPEVRLYQADTDWAQTAKIDVSIYEKGSIASATWKKQSGTASALTYRMQETAVYDGNFSVTENGVYIVTVTDRNGNTGTASIEVSNVDVTKPRVTLEIGATPNAKSGWYTVSTLPVTVSYEDVAGAEGGEPRGIKTVQYKWVTSKASAPTSGFTTATAAQLADGVLTANRTNSYNGTYWLYYKVTDQAGNVTSGFSDEIKKDSYSGGATITGPALGQPLSQGLTFDVRFTYGPSGGRLTGGTTVASAVELAKMDSKSGTGNSTIAIDYTTRQTGQNFLHYYRYSINGDSESSYSRWSRYVYQVDFNSMGGSDIESQLIWTTSTSASSTTVNCKVNKPADPVRTGYTFGGWYTNVGCTDGNAFDFNTQLRANTILYAKWTPNTYTVSYRLTQPDGSAYTPDSADLAYTYAEGLTLPMPEYPGYEFCGWYDNASYQGTAYTGIGEAATGNKTYYAYLKDTETPALTAKFENEPSGDNGWCGEADQAKIALRYSDNAGVTAVYVQVDDGSFQEIGGIPTGDPTKNETTVSYDSLEEGEHTYAFKAVDAAGNETVTDPVAVKLDTVRPVVGDITYEHKEDGFLDWIMGRESLIIHIPISDSGSGAVKVNYTKTTYAPEEDTEDVTVELSGKAGEQTVDVKLDADWKGRISNIVCTDQAGNTSDSKSASSEDGGIIVENKQPEITILEADMSDPDHPVPGSELSEDYYDAADAPVLYVSVCDDGVDGAGITAGIGNITYTINGAGRQTVTAGDGQGLTGSHSFIIPLPSGIAGIVKVAVTASDHAGNTAVKSVDVKIGGQEATPSGRPDYRKDALVELAPGAVYKITDQDGHEFIRTADENGEIPFVNDTGDDLCGKTIEIVRCGDGVNTQDSEPQTGIVIDARPKALDPDSNIEIVPEIAEDADDAQIKITIDVGPGTGDVDREYSTDGGKTWEPVPEDNVIRDLAPGDVIIRDKADDDKPHGEEVTVTIPGSANTITAVFDLNYEDAPGAYATQSGLKYKESLSDPGDPSREGYDFLGWYRDLACGEEDLWNFEEYVTGDVINKETNNYELVDNVITVKLYAKWRENVAPEISASLTDGKEEDQWHPELSYTLSYSDNVAVTKLYVKRDGEAYEELSLSGSGQVYDGVMEGEHTYTFKAEDAAGNTAETGTLTAKLDETKPVLMEAAFEEGYKNLWDWIIRKDSLTITVPVAEAESGIKSVDYTLIPEAGDASGSEQAKVENASGDDNGADYQAEIYVASDFKGSIVITATDNAGNVSDTKTIGVDGGIKGIIVEDNAPVISIQADRMADGTPKPQGVDIAGYYVAAPSLLITVKDEGTTGGLASVTWKVNDGEEQPSGADFTSDMKTEYSCTIKALEGRTGTCDVTVKAVDQAGNTAEKLVTVYVKGKEATPTPSVDYRAEKITGLVPNASYEVGGNLVSADADGNIAIRDNQFGGDLQIVRKGNGTLTTDSASAHLDLAKRPDAPSIEKTDETIKGKKDATLTGVDNTMEYRLNGGNWKQVEGGDGSRLNLAPGEYRFRVSATDGAPYGEETQIVLAEGRTLKVSFDSSGGSSVNSITGKSWNDTVTEPEAPVREGCVVEGWYLEPSYRNAWTFASEQTGTNADRLTDDITLYAKWRDVAKPGISAVLAYDKDSEVWYRELAYLLSYTDNLGVTKLYVKKDDGEYTPIPVSGSGQSYDDILEGAHTYTFKAEDAAGNTMETGVLTAKLDTTKPVLGEASFAEGYRNLWDWIIQKDSLTVTIPVTEAGSGIDSVDYTLIPEDRGQDGIEGQASVKKASDSDTGYQAEILVEADFKGRIVITATDNAGNISDTKTIGVENGLHGVIVEDNAPNITILADREADGTPEPLGTEIIGFYDEAPDLLVTVTDDEYEAVTGGLRSVSYRINGGEEQPVEADFTSSMQTKHEFTIEALRGKTGTQNVTVKAVDQAGNIAEHTVAVRIKAMEDVPSPVIDYLSEKITGLVPDAGYRVGGQFIVADEDGNIAINEDWFGREIKIVKKGDGGQMLDSDSVTMQFASRPDAPDSIQSTGESIKGKKDGELIGIDTTMEYCVDDSEWTAIDDSDITDGRIAGVASGMAQVRVRATAERPCSQAAQVNVPVGRLLTVWFESNGGSEVSYITGKGWNDTLSEPETPVKAGYALEGWYKEPDCRNVWHFDTETARTGADRLTDDMTLYAKWRDAAKPVIKEASYDEGHRNILGWIIGRDSLTVTLPVTEMESGLQSVDYTLIPDGAGGKKSYGKAEVTETGDSGTDYQAVLRIEAGFKGRIEVTATDRAGNISEVTYIGADGSGVMGVAVENTAPVIRADITDGYYDTAPTVHVTVQDAADGAVSSGIASVTYRVGSGEERAVQIDGTQLQETVVFDIPASEIPAGETQICVSAADNAGNSASDAEFTVRVREPEQRPGSGSTGGRKPSGKTPGGQNRPGTGVNVSSDAEENGSTGLENSPIAAGEETGNTSGSYTVKDGRIVLQASDGQLSADSKDADTSSGQNAEPVSVGRSVKEAVLSVDKGTVIVTVNNVDETLCTAYVADAVAVANAVLSEEEMGRVADGAVVEIRIDVTHMDENVSEEDVRVAEQGIEAHREDISDLTMGMYVDISLFMRVNEGEWNAVKETKEPVDITIDIPEELQGRSREFYILRVHEGEYTLLSDMDDVPETITIETECFSTYAICYREGNERCGLCHICPTFLGICCFIWLAIFLAAVLAVVWICRRRMRRESRRRS